MAALLNRIGDRPLLLRDFPRFGAYVTTEHGLNDGRQGVEYAAHQFDVARRLPVVPSFYLGHENSPAVSVQPRRTKIRQPIDDPVEFLVAEGEPQSSDSSAGHSPDPPESYEGV
jgi:hypothetical protein